MKELLSKINTRVERFNPETELSKLAELYTEVFAGPPWNEYTRCGDCFEFFGLESNPGGSCSNCGAKLVLAYPKEDTMNYIVKESNRPDATILVIKRSKIKAFAWGFSYNSPDEFVEEKYRTPEMQGQVKQLLEGTGIKGRFFYFSECGVNESERGQGLSNELSRALLEEAKRKSLPIVMRTNWESPMMAVAETFGMEQIMGPRIEIDRFAKEIRATGEVVNEFLDSEIEERVLFIVRR